MSKCNETVESLQLRIENAQKSIGNRPEWERQRDLYQPDIDHLNDLAAKWEALQEDLRRVFPARGITAHPPAQVLSDVSRLLEHAAKTAQTALATADTELTRLTRLTAAIAEWERAIQDRHAQEQRLRGSIFGAVAGAVGITTPPGTKKIDHDRELPFIRQAMQYHTASPSRRLPTIAQEQARADIQTREQQAQREIADWIKAYEVQDVGVRPITYEDDDTHERYQTVILYRVIHQQVPPNPNTYPIDPAARFLPVPFDQQTVEQWVRDAGATPTNAALLYDWHLHIANNKCHMVPTIYGPATVGYQ